MRRTQRQQNLESANADGEMKPVGTGEPQVGGADDRAENMKNQHLGV